VVVCLNCPDLHTALTPAQELEVESVRALEDLIIDTMYNGLVAGKIDQRQGIFRVKSAVGRDVPPDKVADVAHQLGLWQTRCSALIEALEASSRRVADEREVRRTTRRNGSARTLEPRLP